MNEDECGINFDLNSRPCRGTYRRVTFHAIDGEEVIALNSRYVRTVIKVCDRCGTVRAMAPAKETPGGR